MPSPGTCGTCLSDSGYSDHNRLCSFVFRLLLMSSAQKERGEHNHIALLFSEQQELHHHVAHAAHAAHAAAGNSGSFFLLRFVSH